MAIKSPGLSYIASTNTTYVKTVVFTDVVDVIFVSFEIFCKWKQSQVDMPMVIWPGNTQIGNGA